MLLMGFLFAGCEKDDICTDTTPTTPRLVIEFYDNDEATPTLKNVTNLKAVGEGMSTDEGVVFNATLTNSSRYLSNSSKIYLPLNPSAISTTYTLANNFGAASANVDILTFNYTSENIYVSRACGFKTLFNLNQTNPIVQTEPTVADGTWIKNITVVKYNLENENEIHVKIKF